MTARHSGASLAIITSAIGHVAGADLLAVRFLADLHALIVC